MILFRMEEVEIFNEHAVANPEEVVAMVHMWVVFSKFSPNKCEFAIMKNCCMNFVGDWYEIFL